MLELVMWLIVGILQIISCLSGGEPTWLQYWCVYIVMMLNIMIKKLREKY